MACVLQFIWCYLSDEIYPKWVTLSEPLVRKDIVSLWFVQAQFVIVSGPARLMKEEEIGIIIRVCVILNNMIVEDEQDNYELAS